MIPLPLLQLLFWFTEHPDTPVHYTIGGALSLLITKMVYDEWSKKRNGHSNGASGEKSVDFWRLEIRQAMADSLETKVVPHLKDHTEILRSIDRSLAEERGEQRGRAAGR